jgi:hypothetical protein
MQRHEVEMEASVHGWEAVHSFFTCSSGRISKVVSGVTLFWLEHSASMRHNMKLEATYGTTCDYCAQHSGYC